MRTYNPGNLVRVVIESTSGYIGNLEIFSSEGKNYKKLLFSFWIKITMYIKTIITTVR
jgi:hypothetical protein